MGTIKVTEIIEQASQILVDEQFDLWSKQNLLGYYNMALAAICNFRKDAVSTTANVPTKRGTLQELPANASALIKVTRNMGTVSVPKGGRVITILDQEKLDSWFPNWHSEEPEDLSFTAEHYTYDERVPRNFYVYPAAHIDNLIEVIYAVAPTHVRIADGDWATDTTLLQLEDAYKNAVIFYILWQAYAKESDNQNNAQRAATYQGAFNQSIGNKSQSDSAITPRYKNPLNPQ